MSAPRPPLVVVCGALASRPGRGGHAWVFLQYLLGFQRLGWQVLFLDRLGGFESVDATETPCPLERSVQWSWLSACMKAVGLTRCYALLDNKTHQSVGLDREEISHLVRRAALVIDVNGYLEDEELLGSTPLSLYLDIDPGFFQMWAGTGLHSGFDTHDVYATVGTNIGTAACKIPACGREWLKVRPPVVLSWWPVAPGGSRYSTIASWRGTFAPVCFEGRQYGLRAHQFRRFSSLPSRVPMDLEVALDIHAADARDRQLLESEGWNLVDPTVVAGDPHRYQRYIQAARGELLIGKDMYVQSNSGWFSDRSACYLASSKPVVMLDTGIEPAWRTGCGLLTFSDLDEAAERLMAVEKDYPTHAAGARRLAEELLDSDQVLGDLIDTLGCR